MNKRRIICLKNDVRHGVGFLFINKDLCVLPQADDDNVGDTCGS
jgi:hypothetical protein